MEKSEINTVKVTSKAYFQSGLWFSQLHCIFVVCFLMLLSPKTTNIILAKLERWTCMSTHSSLNMPI